jgi:hypothetical protein
VRDLKKVDRVAALEAKVKGLRGQQAEFSSASGFGSKADMAFCAANDPKRTLTGPSPV